MKVGKEQIGGLAALDQYDSRDHDAEVAAGVEKVDCLVDAVNAIDGLRAEEDPDEAGRAIFRCRVTFDRLLPEAHDGAGERAVSAAATPSSGPARSS